jgi:hypothetical protein
VWVDKTSVELFFSQGKFTEAKQKERSERIRRCRGVYLKHLKGKKTPDERKEYARCHEAILLEKEKAISVKHKERLARQKYEEKVWQEQPLQMQSVLTQPKKLTKKDERQVGDLLHSHFPEVTPPTEQSLID